MKISKIVGIIAKTGIFFGGIAGIMYFSQKKVEKEIKLQKRYRTYYELANQWLLHKNNGRSVIAYLENNGYHSIAIYGMGTLAEVFYEEVKKAGIEVKYFIDKNADELSYGMDNLRVCGLESIVNQEKVDAVIVTPVFDFDTIAKDLETIDDTLHLVSLEDVIFGV